jgi:hypothetical protein
LVVCVFVFDFGSGYYWVIGMRVGSPVRLFCDYLLGRRQYLNQLRRYCRQAIARGCGAGRRLIGGGDDHSVIHIGQGPLPVSHVFEEYHSVLAGLELRQFGVFVFHRYNGFAVGSAFEHMIDRDCCV